MPKCRILTRKSGLKFTCAPKTFPSRSGSQLLGIWKRWWNNWEVVGFGSESNEKNIPGKEQEMMEVGRRHRIHGRGGRWTCRVFPGPSAWERWAREMELKRALFWGPEYIARRSGLGCKEGQHPWQQVPSLFLMEKGISKVLGLKSEAHLLSRLPPRPELMPHSPASVQRTHHGDHSGGPAGGPGLAFSSFSAGITQSHSEQRGLEPSQLCP